MDRASNLSLASQDGGVRTSYRDASDTFSRHHTRTPRTQSRQCRGALGCMHPAQTTSSTCSDVGQTDINRFSTT